MRLLRPNRKSMGKAIANARKTAAMIATSTKPILFNISQAQTFFRLLTRPIFHASHSHLPLSEKNVQNDQDSLVELMCVLVIEGRFMFIFHSFKIKDTISCISHS